MDNLVRYQQDTEGARLETHESVHLWGVNTR